jgi:threonine synthase
VTSLLTHLACARCGREYDADRLHNRCPCGGALLARYAEGVVELGVMRQRPRGMWRYRELLPVRGAPVSLGEPETPLIGLPRLSEAWGVEVHLKDDGPLAGGTFKARGAAVGLSRAMELGARRVVMPSAGNAGGAWSLYAARAGMRITVTMARSAPLANQTEVRLAGGELVLVTGTIADAGRVAADLARDTGAFLATTFSEPYRLEGKKSCWLEVFDRLGGPRSLGFPRTIVLPVGGGVGAVAAAKAAEEVAARGWARGDPPAIVGVQAAGCAPVARAFERGAEDVTPWPEAPSTVAAGLRVPSPPEGRLLLETVRASGGVMVAVDDDAIRRAVALLASTEGVFACPEGAAAIAGAAQLAERGSLEGPVVVYNTGAGAKYADVLGAPDEHLAAGRTRHSRAPDREA